MQHGEQNPKQHLGKDFFCEQPNHTVMMAEIHMVVST